MFVGNKIKKLRKDKGWSLDKLASISSIAKSHLWSIENNLCNLTITKLVNIADALGVSVDYLTSRGNLKLDMAKQEAFLMRFNMLTKKDKERIIQIVGLWSKDK